MPLFKEGDSVVPIKGIRGDGWYGVMCTVTSWSWCPMGYRYVVDNENGNKDFAEDNLVSGDSFMILYLEYNAERIESEKIDVKEFADAMVEHLRQKQGIPNDVPVTTYLGGFMGQFYLIEEAGFRIIKKEE